MSENMKKFLELVSKDDTLRQKIFDSKDMEKEEAIQASISLAKEVGIELTEADFDVKEANNELADDELDAVVGGGNTFSEYGLECNCNHSGAGSGCYCNNVGAGAGGNSDNGQNYCCICLEGGAGDDDSLRTYCTCPNLGHGSNV